MFMPVSVQHITQVYSCQLTFHFIRESFLKTVNSKTINQVDFQLIQLKKIYKNKLKINSESLLERICLKKYTH